MRRLTKTLQSVFWHSLALTLTMPVVFGQVSLQLVSARDHIAGCFTTSQSVYADKNYIYLASWQGQLFVLARNRASNFPLVDTIQVSASPLLAVRGDSNYIYMVSGDGDLHVYQNKAPFLHVNSVPLSSAGLGALALASTKSGESIYVSTGQAQLAAYGSGVYLSPLNQGDVGLDVAPATLSVGQSYGNTVAPNTTALFDSQTGHVIASAPNPANTLGTSSQVSLYADANMLVQTTPGCCGQGIFIRNPSTLALQQFIYRWYTNTVQRRGQWLIGGTESGEVDIFDLGQNPSPQVAAANLRQLTGNTGSEDIEIRALWTDGYDSLVFAASSWGNAQTRSLFLPTFFVLDLKTPGRH